MKKPFYSIRAFSKQIGISASTISRILNGKRIISRKLADQVSQRLMLDPQERAELLAQFSNVHSTLVSEPSNVSLQLNADQYQVVADWRAYAILGLTEIAGFKNDPSWIAERIGSNVNDVKQIIARLLRLEMIVENENGGLCRTHSRYRTTDDVTNLSLSKSHYQNLELAQKFLDNDSIDARDFTWMTFPLDTKKMPEAKTLIRKFQSDLYKVLDSQSTPNEVYRLVVQFFPLTKKSSGEQQ